MPDPANPQNNPAPTNQDPAPSNNPAPTNPVPSNDPAPTNTPVTGDSLWKEKIEALHSDLAKERKTIKDLKTANATLENENNGFKLKAKKADALNTALGNLGEDFEVPSDKLGKLNGLIEKLGDGDDLAASIAEFVDVVKETKQKEATIINSPFAGPATTQTPGTKELSNEELRQLAIKDPAAFRALNQLPLSRG